MFDIHSVVPAFGVICDPNSAQDAGGFRHVATAWHLGNGDWVSVWNGEEKPHDQLQLLSVIDQRCENISNCEIQNGILGFNAFTADCALKIHSDSKLQKRDPVYSLGYPSVIDHPAFSVHRGSLTAERYFPYLCPWTMEAHIALFSADEGYITERFYKGMQGSPVLNAQQEVIGVIVDGSGGANDSHVPLTRFIRVA